MSNAKNHLSTTVINRSWLLKMLLLMVGLPLVLGIWGLIDATVIYPNRGYLDARFKKLAYLKQAQTDGMIADPSRYSVPDPDAELKRLREASSPDSPALSELELRRKEWLESLARVTNLGAITQTNQQRGQLAAEIGNRSKETVFYSGLDTIVYLEGQLKGSAAPKPLSDFDLPIQWLICGVGFAWAGWSISTLLATSLRRYYFEPDEPRLTLPDGRSFTPNELKELDRRKWDKWFVFARLTDGSPEIKLDLLKYHPLEEWILHMEKLSPHCAVVDASEIPEPGAAPQQP